MARTQRPFPWARRRSRDAARPWSCEGCNGVNPGGTRYCGHCGLAADRADVVDEHRLITALFADISGFTTLADRLDTAELHRVISPVIGVLISVAERYEGTIAKYAGDAVLVFFGAPIAVEDHAERAVACAIDMHRALVEAIPRLSEEAAHLELHVGVNTGRVIAGLAGGDIRNDYSILGDAVNVAQRLESVASPGETYVGAMTQELAGHAFEFEDLGGLTLKGKPEPVPAWRVVGARQSTIRSSSRSSTFVGRTRELAELRGLVERLTEGSGAVASIVADPGQGKSRLLEELRADATARGCRWLEARSISYGAAVPYWPFVDLLRRTLGLGFDVDPQAASDKLSEVFDAVASNAAALVGRLLGVPVDSDADVEDLSPEAFNRQLSDALSRWIAHMASEQPLVLVFEDLHWTDSASTDLLRRLVGHVAADRLLLVLSGRPESEALVSALIAGVAESTCLDIRLGPLDVPATGELVADMLGGPVAHAATELIVERTGGNAFFTQELVRTLRENDAFLRADGGWELPANAVSAVPTNVEGVISARIDRLAKPAANVLLAASVVGRRVDLALLDGVTELEGHLPRIIDELVASGLLDRDIVDGNEVVTFHHALVVDVAYGRLVRRQLRDLHRRVAETAEVLYGSGDDVIDLLARHFYLADAGVKAVDYIERAASRAKRLFANDQTITHLTGAIEICRRLERLTSRIPGLLLERADVELLISAYDEALRDFEEVRDRTGDVRAWCGLSSVYRKWGRYDEAVRLIDQALAKGFERDDEARLWLERVAALAVAGRLEDAMADARYGLNAVQQIGGPIAAELMLRLARAEEAAGLNDPALEHALQARVMLEKVGDLRGLAFAHRIIGGLQWRDGDHGAARVTLEAGLALAERTGNAEEVAGCLINLGLALLALDDVDGGIACDTRAVTLFQSCGHRNGEALARSNLGEKLLARGDDEGALEECRRGLAIAMQTGAAAIAAEAQRILVEVLDAQGRKEEARLGALEARRLFLQLGDQQSADDVAAAYELVPEPAGGQDKK